MPRTLKRNALIVFGFAASAASPSVPSMSLSSPTYGK